MDVQVEKYLNFIRHFDVSYLLIVDDLITPHDDYELGFNLFISQTSEIYESILKEITKNKIGIAKEIGIFKSNYKELTEKEIGAIQSGDWGKIWISRKLNSEEESKKKVSIIGKIKEKADFLFNVLLHHGLFKSIPSDYHFFQKLLAPELKIPVRYWNKLTISTIDEIKEDIREQIENINSAVMAIVDKRMKDGDHNGDVFIKEDLLDFCKKEEIRSISCILTTSPSNDHPISNAKSFYAYEVKKDTASIENIYKFLLLGAYVTLMDYLNSAYVSGVEKTYQLSIDNPLNLAHLLEKSKWEDIAPIEVLNNWFLLTSQYFIEKYCLERIHRWGLNRLITKDVYFDEKEFTACRENLESLNYFEHFDKSVSIFFKRSK